MLISTSTLHFLRTSLRTRSQSRHLRCLTTLPSNPSIYIHTDSSSLAESYTLSYLPTQPPNSRLAIGTSSTNPPTPINFNSSPSFLKILQQVLAEHAHRDPGLKAQAAAFASTSGSTLGSGGAFFNQVGGSMPNSRQPGATSSAAAAAKRRSKPSYSSAETGAGGASAQGGYGSGGQTGFMHVADERNPPAYGRIPEPEDIFGSLEVGPDGSFVDGHGHYQDSGTYRVLTREGCLGLSSFLRDKLVERLLAEEAKDGS